MVKMPPISELRRICQPPREESWWFTYIGRPISIYLTKLLLYTPITGNQVTILMLIAGVAAGTLFISGNYWYSIAGALLFMLSILLDLVDGEVARYRKASSLRGWYLDRLTHNIVYPYIFVGISFGGYADFHDIRIFIFGFSASLFVLLMFLVQLERSNILRKVGKEAAKSIITTLDEQTSKSGIYLATLARRIRGKVIDPTSVDIIPIVILIGAIFNWLHIILMIYGILLPCRWLLQATFNLKYGFRG